MISGIWTKYSLNSSAKGTWQSPLHTPGLDGNMAIGYGEMR